MNHRPSITKEYSSTRGSSGPYAPHSLLSASPYPSVETAPPMLAKETSSLTAKLAQLQQSPNPTRPITIESLQAGKNSMVRNLMPPTLSPLTSPVRKKTIQQTFETYLLPPTPPQSESRDRSNSTEEDQFIVDVEIPPRPKFLDPTILRPATQKKELQAPSPHDEPSSALSQACAMLDIALRRNQQRLEKETPCVLNEQEATHNAPKLYKGGVPPQNPDLTSVSQKEFPAPTGSAMAVMKELLILTERSVDRHYLCPSRYLKGGSTHLPAASQSQQVPKRPKSSLPANPPTPNPTIVYVPSRDDPENYDAPRLRHGPGGNKIFAPMAVGATSDKFVWGAPVNGNTVLLPQSKPVAIAKTHDDNRNRADSRTDTHLPRSTVNSQPPDTKQDTTQLKTINFHTHQPSDATQSFPQVTAPNADYDETFLTDMFSLLRLQKQQHDEEFRALSDAVRVLTETRKTQLDQIVQ
eukprot:GILI01013731.1.p1 GENE.GILI01013731.1~~GILI01013731.1.p1  ORF type:complete len:467 (+),score=36.81 GILI01013731.1:30-1430(+)